MWHKLHDITKKPNALEIESYINNNLWQDLCSFLETNYGVMPSIEYSRCSAATGWNIKYKKGSTSLCTCYPNKDYFVCLVTIGAKQAMEAELVLTACSEYVRSVYANAGALNGSRWLMIDVKSKQVLDDVKALIQTRVKIKK